jgi:hypothetical protein
MGLTQNRFYYKQTRSAPGARLGVRQRKAAAFIQHDEKLMISPSFAMPGLLNPKRKLWLRTPKRF